MKKSGKSQGNHVGQVRAMIIVGQVIYLTEMSKLLFALFDS